MKKIVFLLLLSSTVQAQLFGGITMALKTSPRCGTYAPDGRFKVWSCYNLGAAGNLLGGPYFYANAVYKFSEPPPGPTDLKGDYYEWGQKNPVYDRNGAKSFNTAVTYNANFSASFDPDAQGDSWADYGSKSPNDPCPSGFRIPTYDEFAYLTGFNSQSDKHSKAVNVSTLYAVESAASYDNFYAPVIGIYTPFLCTGYHDKANGNTVQNRGLEGFYWSSYYNPVLAKAYYLKINTIFIPTSSISSADPITNAQQVRCTADTGTKCGAFMGPNRRFKEWMCHNLGADTSLDPHTNFQEGLNGEYYQWGRSTVAYPDLPATTVTPSGTWQTAASGGGWGATKGVNDPCPTGYRVPNLADWTNLVNPTYNTITRLGSCGVWSPTAAPDIANYGCVMQISPNVPASARLYGEITLTLPAAGYRTAANGTLMNRGTSGHYWVAEIGTNPNSNTFVFFSNPSAYQATGSQVPRTTGNSVRCIYQY